MRTNAHGCQTGTPVRCYDARRSWFSRWWFGVRRRRAGGLEHVAVEKDDGSNFAFEYGNMAMLHYSRSQRIEEHESLSRW